MGAGNQRWWRESDAEFQAELDRYDKVLSREQVGDCIVITYTDGRVTYAWEQHTVSIGIPRFIGYDSRTGHCYEIPRPMPDEVLAAHERSGHE